MALSISLTDKINVFMTQKCVVKKFHNGSTKTFPLGLAEEVASDYSSSGGGVGGVGGKLGSKTY